MNTKEKTFKGLKLSGIGMLIFNILYLCAIIFVFACIDSVGISKNAKMILSVINVFLTLTYPFLWFGFMMVEPNEARVLMFFGKYKGTVKENGYFWVNPFYVKRKLTLRARNLDGETIKVNDKSGNPIMIGQVVVWKIVDTYKASFDIAGKSYEHFVRVQSDAALRYLAG
ncbi:MAG: SPFH domain-containing protein, partial [Prevotellaceae bacterium]|nr:SPFH domain-containing protein [Prevotellaceae bacterium]